MQKNINKFLEFILILAAGSFFVNVDAVLETSAHVQDKEFDLVVRVVFDKRLSGYRQAYQSTVDNRMADAGVRYCDLGDDEVLLKRLIDQYAKIQTEAFVVPGLRALAEKGVLRQFDSSEKLERALEKIDRKDPFYEDRRIYREKLGAVRQRVHSIIESKRSYQNFKLLYWLLRAGAVGTGIIVFLAKNGWVSGKSGKRLIEDAQSNKGDASNSLEDDENPKDNNHRDEQKKQPVVFNGESSSAFVLVPGTVSIDVIPNPKEVAPAGGVICAEAPVPSKEPQVEESPVSSKSPDDEVRDLKFTDPCAEINALMKVMRAPDINLNPNAVDENGNNAFHRYVFSLGNVRGPIDDTVVRNFKDSLKELFRLGVYCDARNNDGNTPLALLVSGYERTGNVLKKMAIENFIMNYGADIKKLSHLNKSELKSILREIFNKNEALVEMLSDNLHGMTNCLLDRIKSNSNNVDEINTLIGGIFYRGDWKVMQVFKNNGQLKKLLSSDLLKACRGVDLTCDMVVKKRLEVLKNNTLRSLEKT
jgi:hypothetical protein